MGDPVYLDHNATTPVREEVREEIARALVDFGNPSSDHPYGRRARARLERARVDVAECIGATPEEIYFTSGGTESNNLAIRGHMEACGMRGRVVTSSFEHPATEVPCAWLEAQGVSVRRVPCDGEGIVDSAAFEQAVGEDTALVSIMHANNETGCLQPVARLAAAARARAPDVRIHTDAAQSVGKVPVDVGALGVDLLSIAGHKLYAPKGVGALYVRQGLTLAPVVRGAGHERGLRPGTENVPYAAGLGVACRLARAELTQYAAHTRGLRDRLWDRLRAEIPGLIRNGRPDGTLPNTLNVSLPAPVARAVLAGAPEVAASTGSACHEGGELVPSGTLSAMGVPRDRALGALRLTLGRSSSESDVDRAVAALVRSYRAVVEARSAEAPGG